MRARGGDHETPALPASTLAANLLATLDNRVAIVDAAGVILAVNDGWLAFSHWHGVREIAAIGPSANYFDVCANAARSGAPAAAEALEGIRAVCQGRRTDFELEYRHEVGSRAEWFLMKVTPFGTRGRGAVISHRTITSQKRRESDARESALANTLDALPIPAKVLDAEGQARHFNTSWLQMTGMTAPQELGRQWLARLHPDDRPSCERAYHVAARALRSTGLEYRVRCQDGTYRWLLDRAVPRFDDEGRFLGLICSAVDVTDRRHGEARQRELTRRLVTAQEDERRRVARDLHDDLAQRVALVNIGLAQAMKLAPSEGGLPAALTELSRQTAEIGDEVRNLSHELHSATLEALGLVPAIETLCRELSAKGLLVRLVADERTNDIPREAALCLFRIAQGALGNVMKHSGAQHATLTLTHLDRAVVLRVEDAGHGFDPFAVADGLGVLSMRERLVTVRGVLKICSKLGEGTVVEAHVPRERPVNRRPLKVTATVPPTRAAWSARARAD